MSAEVDKVIRSLRSTQSDIYSQLREMEDYIALLNDIFIRPASSGPRSSLHVSAPSPPSSPTLIGIQPEFDPPSDRAGGRRRGRLSAVWLKLSVRHPAVHVSSNILIPPTEFSSCSWGFARPRYLVNHARDAASGRNVLCYVHCFSSLGSTSPCMFRSLSYRFAPSLACFDIHPSQSSPPSPSRESPHGDMSSSYVLYPISSAPDIID